MKETIFEELKAYVAPKRLPPIADRAFAVYEAAGFKLDPAGIDKIKADLAAHAGDLKALTDNIVGLGAFALYLRDVRNDAAGAEAVARIIGDHAPRYAHIAERIGNALQDLALKATDLLDQFTGNDTSDKKRAPKYGESGPPGSLPLKALKPVGAPLLALKDRLKKKGSK